MRLTPIGARSRKIGHQRVRMRAFETHDTTIITINQPIAYFTHGFGSFFGKNGSIPASSASAIIANSSSIVSGPLISSHSQFYRWIPS